MSGQLNESGKGILAARLRRGLPESCPFLGKSCREFASVARPGGVAQRVRTPSSQKGDDKGMDRPRFSAPNQRLNVGLQGCVFWGQRMSCTFSFIGGMCFPCFSFLFVEMIRPASKISETKTRRKSA